MTEYLVITTSVDLLRVMSDDLVFITSDGNYSTLNMCFGQPRMVTIQLGQLEKLIYNQLQRTGSNFIRIGKSLIVNREHIHYINIPKQQLIMKNGTELATLTASREALRQLKDLIGGERK